MPSLAINLPSSHATASLIIRALNETQSVSNTNIPKNYTALSDRPSYTSDQNVKSISKLLAPYICYIGIGISIVGTVLLLIFLRCLLKCLERPCQSRRPPTYPVFGIAPPSYRESVDTLPPYGSLDAPVEMTTPSPVYTP